MPLHRPRQLRAPENFFAIDGKCRLLSEPAMGHRREGISRGIRSFPCLLWISYRPFPRDGSHPCPARIARYRNTFKIYPSSKHPAACSLNRKRKAFRFQQPFSVAIINKLKMDFSGWYFVSVISRRRWRDNEGGPYRCANQLVSKFNINRRIGKGGAVKLRKPSNGNCG